MPPQMSSHRTHVESQPTAADRAELVALFINEVLTDYLQIRNEGIGKTITSGDQVLSKWMATKAELEQTNRARGSLFNPLQSIAIGETTHSALLGDLLNPRGSHGQGSLFLESFLTLIGVPEPAVGKWAVTVERGRIDILLRRLRPSSVIVIENKSNYAIDQNHQLYRYWYHKIHSPYPKLKDAPDSIKRSFKIVYLTPGSSKEPVGNSLERPAEWDSIKDLPKSVPNELLRILTFQELVTYWQADPGVRISETNARLTTFLHFYSELWQLL